MSKRKKSEKVTKSEASADEPLSDAAKQRFVKCCEIIRTSDQSYLTKGKAIAEVKAGKLWKDAFANWEMFVAAHVLGESGEIISRVHLQRYIDFAEKIAPELEAAQLPMPQNFGVARRLMECGVTNAVDVWKKVLKSKKRITGNLVRELAGRMPKPHTKQQNVISDPDKVVHSNHRSGLTTREILNACEISEVPQSRYVGTLSVPADHPGLEVLEGALGIQAVNGVLAFDTSTAPEMLRDFTNWLQHFGGTSFTIEGSIADAHLAAA